MQEFESTDENVDLHLVAAATNFITELMLTLTWKLS